METNSENKITKSMMQFLFPYQSHEEVNSNNLLLHFEKLDRLLVDMDKIIREKESNQSIF